jgi:hypothetical protein
MASPTSIDFPSGIRVIDPLQRIERFLKREYAWYDAYADRIPNVILPFDVLVATGVNAFVANASVTNLRTIHDGLVSECSAILQSVPADADLASSAAIDGIVDLVIAGTRAQGAQAAVVTKVLHRKRRQAIPILDSVVVGHYCDKRTAAMLADGAPSGDVRFHRAMEQAFLAVQSDLVATAAELATLQALVVAGGWNVGTLRLHDILAWTEVEPRGYYR